MNTTTPGSDRGEYCPEGLRQLESRGVRLIVRSTCFDYFEPTGKVQVGIVGGTGEILEAQIKAEKVITL